MERGQLRAGEDCPDELKPLVELMYRGALWHNPKGRDWTVAAFLGSSAGPDLDIASDHDTIAALHGALDQVALTPVRQLRGRRLDASDFSQLAGVDVMRDILRWMADPEGARSRMDGSSWNLFRTECRGALQFDPETEADVTAGTRLGAGAGRWADAWARFVEAPDAFPGIPELLARSRPANELAFDRERWPDLNGEDEESVRAELWPGSPKLSHDGRLPGRSRRLEHGARPSPKLGVGPPPAFPVRNVDGAIGPSGGISGHRNRGRHAWRCGPGLHRPRMACGR